MESTTVEESTTIAATMDKGPCSVFYFWFGTLLCGSCIGVGLVGNALSVVILSKERKKSSTIQALRLLAVADTLVLVAFIYIPTVGFRMILHGWDEAHNQTVFSALYLNEVARVFNLVSALMTMILTWQRYIAVCLPHKAKKFCTIRTVNVLSACSYISSIVFYLPNFFLYSLETTDNGLYQSVSHSLVFDPYFQMIYTVILTYLLSYFIPVIMLLTMSVGMLRSLRSSRLIQGTSAQHVRKDLTKSSIAIVVVFVVCQSFQPIRRVLMWAYDPYLKHTLCGGVLLHFSGIPHLALMLNSAANFAIYILFAKGFRKRLIVLLIRSNTVVPNDSSTGTTMTITAIER